MAARAEKTKRLPWLLQKFWIRSLASFGLMFLLAYLEARGGNPGERFGPLVDAIFGDLLEYVPTFRLLHTAAFFQGQVAPAVAYPPFGAALFAVLYSVSRPVVFYLAIALLWLGGGVWRVRAALMERGMGRMTATLFPLTIAVVSFPVEGMLQRGNIELFVWVFAGLGVWAYVRGWEEAAAILWGLAAAVKLYPIVYLVLLLPRQRFRAFFVGMGTFVGVSLVSMVYLGPRMATVWAGSLKNVFGYQGFRVAEWSGRDLSVNHSVFGLVKAAAAMLGHSSGGLMIPYYLCGAAVFAMVFFGRVRKMPMANQLLAVTALMVMLPPISYFYTLVHLYAPWLVLVFLAIDAEHGGVRVRGLGTTVLLFVPLFASYTLFTFRGMHLYGGVVQALLLVVLFGCAAWFPFEVRQKIAEVTG